MVLALGVRRLWPGLAPPPELVLAAVAVFALPGLWYGFLTLRSRTVWFVYASLPLCANALVLALPGLLWRAPGGEPRATPSSSTEDAAQPGSSRSP
jgi:hypothetical protein